MKLKLGAVQQITLIAIAPLLALATGIGFAISRSDAAPPPVATIIFQGVSTAAAGSEFPFVMDPNDVVVREDGAYGIAYEYGAVGQASGSVTGSFTYLERGRIYLSNPSDPNTVVGNALLDATFSVYPSGGPSNGIVISDQCTTCYEYGHETAGLSDVPAWARGLVSRIATSQGSTGENAMAQYGFFTFSTDQGTFKGYSTPDYREFVIQVRVGGKEAAEVLKR